MITPTINRQKNNTILLFLTGTLVFLSASCGRKINFGISSVVPAAQGYVEFRQDKNKNYDINVSIKNLANPERLSPPRQVYVVWMVTRRDTINIGQIATANTLLSGNLKASLHTTTPYRPVLFYITAEDRGNKEHSGSQVVLMTSPF